MQKNDKTGPLALDEVLVKDRIFVLPADVLLLEVAPHERLQDPFVFALDLQVPEGASRCLDDTYVVDVGDEELTGSEGVCDQTLREEIEMFEV